MRILCAVSIILTISFSQTTIFAQETVESKVFKLIKQKDWQNAYNSSNKIGNQPLKKIVLSQQFLDNSYSGNSFEKIVKFLQENPGWPQEAGLKVSAESLLNDTTDSSLVFKWFQSNKPLTGRGYKYYALAAGKIIKDSQRLSPIIKKGWHNGSFSMSEQKAYQTTFKNYLDIKDHIKRIDNLLFAESTTAAKNNLYLVGAEYKKSFEVQIALIQNGSSALGRFSSVPKKYYTPGLIYRYIELKKKSLPPSSEITNLIEIARSDPDHADAFWKIQSYLAREYIEHKLYNDAYKIACCHFTENAANKSDAQFLSGWIALRFLNKAQLSLEHFRGFNETVKTPMSKSRGIYWLGRAHEALKDKEKAHKLYNLAATKYPYTFYGQISAHEMGMKKIALPPNINLAAHKVSSTNSVKYQIAKATYLVSKYGSNSLSQLYIKAAVEKSENTAEILDLATILSSSKNTHHMAWLAKYAVQKHVLIKNHAFPMPYKPATQLPLEKALMYSIIRQESVFDQRAVSSANAMGLMQLIKGTACDTAKSIGDACNIPKLTTDPLYNMKLGSNYLKQMIEKFDGSYIMAIAAYNGGHVKKWLGIYGDPRTMNNPREVLDWIESIPFYETRNYVQRVLENLQIYRSILNENATLKIAQDLVLNKKKGA